jgi:GT2 family glycosyltransferase/tetratricopeptide (TPR) repeat protein
MRWFNRARRPGSIVMADRARAAGQWEEAARHYKKSLDRNPRNWPIWVQYGHALKEAGRLPEAEAAYRQAISYSSCEADSHLQLGHVLKLQGRRDEARAAYVAALALDLSLSDPRRELADLGWSAAELAAPRQPGHTIAPSGGDIDDEKNAALAGDPAEDPRLELHLDRPQLDGDRRRAATEIRGRLQIEGWALARDGVAGVTIAIDGENCGTARYGIRRYDVHRDHGDWPNSALSGYTFAIADGIAPGEHTVRVELRAATGRAKAIEFAISFAGDQLPVERLRREMPRAEIDLARYVLSGLGWRPRFGILLGVGDADDEFPLDATLHSLRAQAYGEWRAAIAGRGSAVVPRRLRARLAAGFPDLPVHIIPALEAGDLVEAFAAIDGGRPPDFVAVISAGDVLACDALLRLAVATGLHRDADFFYGDERRPSPITGRAEAFLKPQWSPDLLLATNYIGRLWCAEPGLLERVGAGLRDWRDFGEYDLVLRCTEAAQGIRHVPHLLCERGTPQIDPPAQEREALARAMARRGIEGRVAAGCAPGYYRVSRRPRGRGGLVSIIIPTRASDGRVRTCIDSLRRVTAYRNIEIIAVDDIPAADPEAKSWLRANADKVVPSEPPFNWSRYNNRAVRQAGGEFLLFLNDDTEITEPDWIAAMLQHAERPEIGIVGARLLYPDGGVQHAGMFWPAGGGSGRHAFRFFAGPDPGYFGLALTTRNVLLVTGACIMVRRELFATLGGFDERHWAVNNDADFCLRCWSAGKLIVYEPAATLYHHEAASRRDLPDEYDGEVFWQTWRSLLAAGDPYYHPNLSRTRDDYAFEEGPAPADPLPQLAELRRGLAR